MKHKILITIGLLPFILQNVPDVAICEEKTYLGTRQVPSVTSINRITGVTQSRGVTAVYWGGVKEKQEAQTVV